MDNKKSSYSIYSILSLIAAILSMGIFGTPDYNYGAGMIFSAYAVICSVVSLVLPIIAKKQRLKLGQKGTALEIIAIVIGGFTFYTYIFAHTDLQIIFGYLGWVFSGVIYASTKLERNEKSAQEASATTTAEKDTSIGSEEIDENSFYIDKSIKQTDAKLTGSPQEDAANAERNEAMFEDISNTSSITSPVLFCHKCGAKLLEGSVYCSKCGTKVWVNDKTKLQKE